MMKDKTLSAKEQAFLKAYQAKKLHYFKEIVRYGILTRKLTNK